MKKLSLLILVLFLFAGISSAQNADTLLKVTDGVYVTPGFIGNISLLITDEGVVVVDAGDNPQTGQKLQDLIMTVTDKPIVFVILTHYHFDHTGGLVTFPNQIPILAHEQTLVNLRNREKETKSNLNIQLLVADSLKKILSNLDSKSTEYTRNDSILKVTEKSISELSKTRFIFPNQLMKDEFIIIKGKDTVVVNHRSIGHTNGDLTVYFKNKKAMVMGDLFFNHAYPYIDPIGNTSEWIKSLRGAAQMDLPYYIPGHGKIAVSSDLLVLAKYLEDLNKAIAKLKSEGKSLDEAKKIIALPEKETFDFQFFREQNIEAVWNK